MLETNEWLPTNTRSCNLVNDFFGQRIMLYQVKPRPRATRHPPAPPTVRGTVPWCRATDAQGARPRPRYWPPSRVEVSPPNGGERAVSHQLTLPAVRTA